MKFELDERFTEVTSEEMTQVEGGGFFKNFAKRFKWYTLLCPCTLFSEITYAAIGKFDDEKKR